MGVATTAYWLLGRAINTMDDWVNEPDPDDWDDQGWDPTDARWWDSEDFDDPEYD